MSRTRNLANNIMWSYVGTFSILILGLVVRTVFVYSLGETMLGLNSLFASVIGVLSIAELGIGAILNTQLYRPMAIGDMDTVVAITQLYRKTYVIIAGIVLVLGLALIPVLDLFLKGAEDVPYTVFYYLFFLFNTVISFISIYKFGVSNAEQKNYIEININTVFTLLMYIGQIVALLWFRSYFYYLAAQSFVLLIKAVFTNVYMSRRYPIFRIREQKKLSEENRIIIKKNVFAGIVNKFADSAINQTDSMIISAFVNVNVLGMVSNYTTLRGYLERFSKPLLDNMGSIVGNFINTENEERRRLLIKALQCYAMAIYGYLALLLFFMSTPFVRVWLGDNFIISSGTVLILALNLMLSGVGDRPYVIFKNSHGNFYNDWYVVLFTAIMNLVVSIAFVIPYGINGVFMGTSASILLSVIWRPLIYYKQATGEKVRFYFLRLMRNYFLVIAIGLLVQVLTTRITYANLFTELIIKFMILTLSYFGVFVLAFWRMDEFQYLLSKALHLIRWGRK